jgi:hypothetical protein
LPYTPPTLATAAPTTTTTVVTGSGSCDISPNRAHTGPPKVIGVTGFHGGSTDNDVDRDPSTAADVGCYRVYRSLAKAGPFDLTFAVPVEGTTVLTPPGFQCQGKCDSSDLSGPHGYAQFYGSKFRYNDSVCCPPVAAGNPCCFFYRVAAVDDAGKEGPRSDVLCVPVVDTKSRAAGTGCT